MPRILSSLLMLVIVLGSNFCESCHEKSQPQNKVVFCLFDLSASTEAAATRQKYSDSFKRILDKIVDGDAIVADAITDNPLSQSSFPVNEEFPLFKTDTDNDLIVNSKRKDFESQLKEKRAGLSTAISTLLSDQSRKINRTKILDAMQLADRVFHTYNRSKKVLVVFSDMIEESDHYNFQKQRISDAESQQIIAAEKQAGRLPDLSGIRVYVIGSAVSGRSSSEKFESIERFWQAYFKATGADLSKERYGAALLIFDE